MTDWDALETPLTEKPLFMVERPGKPPADPRKWPEAYRQKAFVAFIRKTAPGIIVASFANEGKRGLGQASKMKAQGLSAGMPDIVAMWDGGWAFCEFKGFSAAGRAGSLSVNQSEACNRIHKIGHSVACFFTAEAALDWLRALGAPIPSIAHI